MVSDLYQSVSVWFRFQRIFACWRFRRCVGGFVDVNMVFVLYESKYSSDGDEKQVVSEGKKISLRPVLKRFRLEEISTNIRLLEVLSMCWRFRRCCRCKYGFWRLYQRICVGWR